MFDSKKTESTIFMGTFIIGSLVTVYTAYRACFYTQDYFLFFEMLLGMGTLFVPILFTKLTRITIPTFTKFFYWLFLIFSIFIGTGLQVIAKVSFWDKILHLSSAMLLVAVGYGIIGYLLPKNLKPELSPLCYLLFGLTFGLTCGIFWEFYEFACDGLLGMNLQRYANHGKELIGRAALMDTMGDLITNTCGAFLFSLYSYFKSKNNVAFFQQFKFERH
ncbi:hypothetical protein ACFFIF_09515 [Vagococcus entomophilus]|uniref:Uncharacterized protein n=1 Tax=Vagococcus entomophilus TaxID=1160095 RepID=A0A430AGK4_9ENTE|nr:hypothetical protein [Vagococcus entomophilus]RSU07013.1 hypothetical protein CBF30_07060 [Vagococcus entomophilus]